MSKGDEVKTDAEPEYKYELSMANHRISELEDKMDKLRAELTIALEALEKIVEADRMRYGCDPYPVIAARALEKIRQ